MKTLLDPLENELALIDARAQSSKLTRPVDIEKREIVTQQFAKERQRQARLFDRSKSKRLWMAARKIALDQGEDFDRLRKRKDDASQAKARRIARLAQLDVAEDHTRRMAQIDQREAGALNSLVDTARDRENGPQPSHAPKRLTDQRNAPDRLPFNRSR